MKEYTITHEIELIKMQISAIFSDIQDLEKKLIKAKEYPQLLNDAIWCDIK
jgi:hypothetical protein